jgi:hypothetical protein
MKKLQAIVLLACCAGFVGCSVDDEFEGPSLNDIYGSFSVMQPLDISNRQVDFSQNETTYLTAVFSKNIAWKVQVKGLNSGGIKEISGFSNYLDADNTLWNGTVSRLPMMRAELCAIELTFENEPDTLRDTLEVTAGRVNQGLLLSDFENGFPDDWVPFVQSGGNMTFIVQTGANAAQGNKYYDMGGNVDWDWLKGMFDIPASAYGSETFALSSNPGAVYFNTMLYKPTDISNALVLFQFREDDNQDGVYNSTNEDMFSIEVSPDEDGWSLLSVKYEDLVTLVNGAASVDIGNGIREPHKLMQVSVLFLANPNSGYTQSYLDYMIFTENSPLIP